MLTSFLAIRNTASTYKMMSTSMARGMATMSKDKPTGKTSEGQAALNHVKELYKKGQYEDALKKIGEIETKYPGCTKATKYYRGEVAYAMLEKSGDIKKFRPTI